MALIRRLLINLEVPSQEALVRELTQAGFAVTQSSISRDLADIGVEKVRGRYVLRAATEAQELGIHSARSAGPNLLVLRTSVGAAQVVAYKLDQLGLNEIVGTVAGDDTIFVATTGTEDQFLIMKALGLAEPTGKGR